VIFLLLVPFYCWLLYRILNNYFISDHICHK